MPGVHLPFAAPAPPPAPGTAALPNRGEQELPYSIISTRSLIPPAGTYSSQKAYKVDVKSQELVEVPHA